MTDFISPVYNYMYYIDAESLTYNRETMSFADGVENLFNDQIHLTDESRITWANNWMLPESWLWT